MRIPTFVASVVVLLACTSEPPSPETLFRLRTEGEQHLRLGELAAAESAFARLAELVPNDAYGHANLGLTYYMAGRFADAEGPLRRARRLAPDDAGIALIHARLLAATNRRDDARDILNDVVAASPNDARALFALAQLDAPAEDSTGQPVAPPSPAYASALRRVVAAQPSNVALRVMLLKLHAGDTAAAGAADSVLRHLEELRRLRPEPPAEARPLLASAMRSLQAGDLRAARPQLDRFIAIMESTAPYQAAFAGVKWLDDPAPGRPVIGYQPATLIAQRARNPIVSGTVRFVDGSAEAGLLRPGSDTVADAAARIALVSADVTGDNRDDVLHGSLPAQGQGAHLLSLSRGRTTDLTDSSGLRIDAGAHDIAPLDFDNDGWMDLFVVTRDQRVQLWRNTGNGAFTNVTTRARLDDVRGAHAATVGDFDHDGDLDVYVAAGTRAWVLRNNLDGTFSDAAQAMGLDGAGGDARDAAIGDLDGDGRIDLVAADARAGVVYFHNEGLGRYAPRVLPDGDAGATAVHVTDYDNNGALDLVATLGDGRIGLWRNDNAGLGSFSRDRRSDATLSDIPRYAHVALLDADNDGWVDLLVAGRGAARLLRNDEGTFSGSSIALPSALNDALGVLPLDVDEDGDLDVVAANAGGLRLAVNDGGNARLSTQVSLVGLRTGSGKNNTYGVGARVELRAGELYQTRVVTGRVTHFGLGPHLKADVLRVEWPNGVPQTVYFPGTDADVLELEQLKGSCAFLYTWDGTRFRFVTDVMWRSALGMPLGIMGAGDGGGARRMAYAPAGASQEYLRIPGDALRPRDGRYVLQVTEELWETAYLDGIRLLAVDHPDSVDVYVDERFVPPAPVELRIFEAVGGRPPRSAHDGRGNDVLPALRAADNVYVSSLTATRYQGVVEPHELVMDLGPDAGRPGAVLFLRGWIYPTDASINVALAQQSALQVAMPSLEVRGADGRWTTARANIGFPSGKDKTIAIELNGMFPTNDHHVRVRTNMAIYWDQAIVARHVPGAGARVSPLALASADLHERGFSRMYRRGGRYGPHWFDYDSVTAESPWRPIEGAFTRFGDVRPLLHEGDDRYVIMAPGDEATISFEAPAPPPDGWRRTFLLYTDGWIKDSDLNTAFGTTVEPLPFHAIREYPYAAGESYPADAGLATWQREYNTRIVRRGND